MSRISHLWYRFRCRCQRFKRGYAYRDVWNLDSWFISTVQPMLVHLRDHGIGIPLAFDNPHGDRSAWKNMLTEMINCLDMMDEEKVIEHLGGGMEIEDYKKCSKIMEENKNKFFELFSMYFFDLWD